MAKSSGADSPALSVPEKKLQLLMELDACRDSATRPEDLLRGVMDIVAKAFKVDASFLFTVEPASEASELKAEMDWSGKLGEWPSETLSTLDRMTRDLTDVSILHGPEIRSLLSWSDDSLQLAAVPIVLRGADRVGTLLLARAGRPFTSSEMDLLEFAETQLDSALVQARRLHELDLRNRDLEAIFRVDQIRDAPLDFGQMLDAVLEELKQVIPSDLAFLMLKEPRGGRLDLRATSPKEWAPDPGLLHDLEVTSRKAVERTDLVVLENPAGGQKSIMCTPLILREQILGVIGLTAGLAGSFGIPERRLLRAIASQMDTAIFESLERGRLRNVLDRAVDPQIMARLLEASDVGILEGERLILTVLYGDLRGSTQLAETADPIHLVDFLNDYLGEMAEIILSHQGTLDKFMGDEVMALFGAPLPMDGHALRAVQVGMEMQRAHRGLMRRWKRRGMDAPPLGVGIATGEMIVGELGSGRRADYTVLGAPANLGARIQGIATGGQVLVCEETYRLIEADVKARPIPGLRFKGIDKEVTAYEVKGPKEAP